MIKISFFVFFVLLLFLGCSSKEYYTPEKIESTIPLTQRLDSSIIETSGENATLDDGTIITKSGLSATRFPQGYRFVFKNDDWALGLKTGVRSLL